LTHVLLGRYNCVGQRLAMMNISHLVALLVSKYDIVSIVMVFYFYRYPCNEITNSSIHIRNLHLVMMVLGDMRDNFTMNPGGSSIWFSNYERRIEISNFIVSLCTINWRLRCENLQISSQIFFNGNSAQFSNIPLCC